MEKKLEKSWKNKMMSALGALTVAVQPVENVAENIPEPKVEQVQAQVEQEEPKKPFHTIEDFNVPFGQHPMDNFLKPISHLESSGGKNTKHTTVDYGMHEGDTALGKFALMPKTVKNIAAMLHSPSSVLRRHIGEHYQDPEVQDFKEMPEPEIAKRVKGNRPLQTRMARYLAAHLHELHNGDTDRMAHGWRFGHNRASDKIPDQHLEHSGYVQKFRKLTGSKQ